MSKLHFELTHSYVSDSISCVRYVDDVLTRLKLRNDLFRNLLLVGRRFKAVVILFYVVVFCVYYVYICPNNIDGILCCGIFPILETTSQVTFRLTGFHTSCRNLWFLHYIFFWFTEAQKLIICYHLSITLSTAAYLVESKANCTTTCLGSNVIYTSNYRLVAVESKLMVRFCLCKILYKLFNSVSSSSTNLM